MESDDDYDDGNDDDDDDDDDDDEIADMNDEQIDKEDSERKHAENKNGDEKEDKNKAKAKVKSLKKLKNQLSAHFQITYYKLTHGKRKTPLQILTTNSVYGRTRSKRIITNLNFIGATTSYPEMKRERRLKRQYTLSCSRPNEAPVPSHFSKKGWTMGALDNENFADQSSISGTKVKNYTAQVLYQDASEEPVAKPSVSSTGLKKSLTSAKDRLSRQELTPYQCTNRQSDPLYHHLFKQLKQLVS